MAVHGAAHELRRTGRRRFTGEAEGTAWCCCPCGCCAVYIGPDRLVGILLRRSLALFELLFPQQS